MKSIYPIIIVGMHRSGTTMITRMLEELGLFVGVDNESNNEPRLFIKMNNWLLDQSGSHWDNPSQFKMLLQCGKAEDLAVRYIENILNSRYISSFMGKEKRKNFVNPHGFQIPWGWKDPRNTFTLPIWLKIFPDARIIHVKRNGVDVANSLKVRYEKEILRVERKWAEGKYALKSRFGKPLQLRNIAGSVRVAELEGGFSLWEEYVEEADKHVVSLRDRAMEEVYEDFLKDPEAGLKRLAKFCGLSVSDGLIEKVAAKAKKDRGNAFQQSAELSAFSKKVSDRLKRFGY